MGNKFLEKQVQMMAVQRIVDWRIGNRDNNNFVNSKFSRCYAYDVYIKNLLENKISEYKL
jgi:hypothetical protein